MALLSRQTQDSGDQFLDLISNPFQSQIQVNSIYASIVWAFVVSGLLFGLFVLLRPRNSRVYAPRAKAADHHHAPTPLAKTPFAWVQAVKKVDEHDLVERIGLDAVVFLRFLRMLRNIFVIFAIGGCALLIPLNVAGGHDLYSQWSNVATLMKFTPQYIFGQKFWGYVALAYIFQAILFYFIWRNYRAVLALRRRYFESSDHRNSLHARTVLINHIPKQNQNEEGISEIVREIGVANGVPKTAAARNVGRLPHLIQEHDESVRKLEGYLSKFLACSIGPTTTRPTCKVAKDDRERMGSAKVDAIDYHQERIRRLRGEIEEIRQSVDERECMSYGFASFAHIEDAHATAYATRKRGPQNSDVRLAPKPHDLIWRNLAMSRATRRRRQFFDGLWMVLLTIAYIPLNILSSVFLSDFSHLGLLWPDFRTSLAQHPVGWGIAQGIVAPLFQFLIFLGLPTVFRRLYQHSGDISKTSRERHVMSRLYAFFIFNNLFVFSVFGSAFRFLAAVIEAQDQDVWDAIRNAHMFTNLMAGLCNVSTFWLTYQMQQNLSAAIDIAQLLPLVTRWFNQNPTPRERIEASAPTPFDYASYYNSYLYISTVGMTFGILQPLIFPITAFYLFIELIFKRYIMQYVAITKTESGGMFWRVLVNRLLVANIISNAVVALIVGAQGIGSYELIADEAANAGMLYALIPLPFLIWLFKWYCSRTFDDKLRYYSTTPKTDLEDTDGTPLKGRKVDRVAVRFGHPALYRKLITPMVDAKSEPHLKELLSVDFHHNRSIDAGNNASSSVLGYSDVFASEPTEKEEQVHASNPPANQSFEFVQQEDMEFENFKRRAEFRDQFGGDGELYGHPEDLISRSGTPSTMRTLISESPVDRGVRRKPVATTSRAASPVGKVDRAEEDDVDREDHALMAVDVAPPEDVFVHRGRAASVDVEIPDPGLDVAGIVHAGTRIDGKV